MTVEINNSYIFSVFENNYYQSYTIVCNEQFRYPYLHSIEDFYGRKCFEFEYTDGSNSMQYGIFNSDFDILFLSNQGKVTFLTRRNPYNNVDISIPLNISIEKGEKYLFCFDTKLNRAMLVNKNVTYTFTYNRGISNHWFLTLSQGIAMRSTSGKIWFHKFETPLPSGFFSLVDRRHFEYETCKNVFLFHQILFLQIFPFVLI